MRTPLYHSWCGVSYGVPLPPLDDPPSVGHIPRVTVQSDPACPAKVGEFADQAAEYVRRAVGTELEYDSDTLPLLDHYLRTVETDEASALELVVITAGAYFGEVVRRHLGARWEGVDGDPHDWRVVLPTGLSVSPAGIVAAAIIRNDDLEGFDTGFDAPARMLPYVEQALQRMGETSEDDYFSLCGRLDTLEHLQEVIVAVAAQLADDAPN
jgi:hypothetical protein